jgi:hypothetical protein
MYSDTDAFLCHVVFASMNLAAVAVLLLPFPTLSATVLFFLSFSGSRLCLLGYVIGALFSPQAIKLLPSATEKCPLAPHYHHMSVQCLWAMTKMLSGPFSVSRQVLNASTLLSHRDIWLRKPSHAAYKRRGTSL